MIIKKGMILYIKNQKVILMEDIEVDFETQALVALNYWNQCDYEDITVLPISPLPYKTEKEKFELYKTNIILGEVKDLCLI